MINVAKLHSELAAAGLPVVSVRSTGEVEYSRELTGGETSTAAAIVAAHDPVDYAEIESNQARDSIKDEYQTALTTLETIRDRDPATVTTAQVVGAVQYMAKVLVFMIKFLARRLVD